MKFFKDFFSLSSNQVDLMDSIYSDYLSLDKSHNVEAVQRANPVDSSDMISFMIKDSLQAIKAKYQEISYRHSFACLEPWPDEDDGVFDDAYYPGFIRKFLNDYSFGSLSSFGGAEGVVVELIRAQMDSRVIRLALELGIQPSSDTWDCSEEFFQIIRKFDPNFKEENLNGFYEPESFTYLLPEWVLKPIFEITGVKEDLKGNPLN